MVDYCCLQIPAEKDRLSSSPLLKNWIISLELQSYHPKTNVCEIEVVLHTEASFLLHMSLYQAGCHRVMDAIEKSTNIPKSMTGYVSQVRSLKKAPKWGLQNPLRDSGFFKNFNTGSVWPLLLPSRERAAGRDPMIIGFRVSVGSDMVQLYSIGAEEWGTFFFPWPLVHLFL